MPSTVDVIQMLADGQLHSGSELAAALGCSRTAVWKHMQGLDELGLELAASPGRGYQLSAPLELLDSSLIRASLDQSAARRLQSLQLEPVMDSTSETLRNFAAPGAGRMHAALTEFQRGGRGRRGRSWLSPFASGLCLSVSWTMEAGPGGFAGLSLALGVAAHGTLEALGARDVGLKWPNDLVVGDGKLGGLLLDLEGEAAGPLKLVAGIGINVRRDARLRAAVGHGDALPPVALDECCAQPVSRNVLAAGLIAAFGDALAAFELNGFEPFADSWRRLDVLHGKPVSVRVGARTWRGEARGIAPDGALLVARNGELEAVLSGDVTVRRGQ
ncbi:MAG: biotin--[acetyl-CoA-carboxylase] ligase [Chromatiales bacterium]|nr:MAG: biotin--[acetyl-CoA-carboxylase] ligase [Chromatiales bacterium]